MTEWSEACESWKEDLIARVHQVSNDPFVRAGSWFFRRAEQLLGFERDDPRLDVEARNLWPLPCRILDRIGNVLHDYGINRAQQKGN